MGSHSIRKRTGSSSRKEWTVLVLQERKGKKNTTLVKRREIKRMMGRERKRVEMEKQILCIECRLMWFLRLRY